MRLYRHRRSWGTSGRRPKRSAQLSQTTTCQRNGQYMNTSPDPSGQSIASGCALAPSAPSIAPHGPAGQGHGLSCQASTARTQASMCRAVQRSTRPTSTCFTVSSACRIMRRLRHAAELDHNGLRRGAANGSRPDVPTLDHEGLRRRLQGPVGSVWPLAKPTSEFWDGGVEKSS